MSRENTVGEALVVTKIQIGLCAVVEHINFAVLERIHRSGIDVQIRIEFLEDNAQAAQLKQCTERSRGQAFAQGTDNAASDENVFHERALLLARASLCSSATASSGVSTPGDPCFVTST